MKIVKNKCLGGFSLTEAVYKELGIAWDGYGYLYNEDLNLDSDNYNLYRADKKLIAAIEKIGLEESAGKHASLKIIDIPDDIDWYISESEGIETIHEDHQRW